MTNSLFSFAAAMHVHFRTKKREHVTKANDSYNAALNRQRKRNRLNTKTKLRKKTLRESSSINEERKGEYFEIMSVDYMSSEHTVSDGENEGSDEEAPKLLYKHKLPWRSEEADSLMAYLEKKVRKGRGQRSTNMMYRRKDGANSKKTAPIDAPDWAVKHQL
ncbi:uncharacterized protein LOC116618840 [Nematostella vectensis]|uniref:uncharacterized protein LOC116618840 n=1 Tax=Nematostella vectensis TaxID=45351 RepID=UPI002076F0F9|nr:uncharacterized protein LOC116618840 [Nematostella vectensis]